MSETLPGERRSVLLSMHFMCQGGKTSSQAMAVLDKTLAVVSVQ